MKTTIISASIALSLLFSLVPTTKTFAWNPVNTICTYESPEVNVRSGPLINSKIKYQIPVGEWIEILETRNGWSRIYFRGNYRNSQDWVRSDFICGDCL